MRRGDKTPADLDRPDGNGLQENYELHDLGHQEFVRRMRERGLTVFEWGIDMRHDDGEDGIVYDDKMDFKVYDGDDLVALVDVKTKGSPRYMGRFNERHYVHYYGHAKKFDVPTFVVMFQVDYDTGTIYDEFVFEIRRNEAEMYESVLTSDSDAVPRFPDGNDAVMVPHAERLTFQHLVMRIEEERTKQRVQKKTFDIPEE
jgi:hypothetical protein